MVHCMFGNSRKVNTLVNAKPAGRHCYKSALRLFPSMLLTTTKKHVAFGKQNTFMTVSCCWDDCAHSKKKKKKNFPADVSLASSSADDANEQLNPGSIKITASNLRSKSAEFRWINSRRKSLHIMNRWWTSGSDEQVPPSPPQPVDWDQWRQKSVRWNWCGHQVEDPLTARLAWAPFDCWCTPIRRFASARQFYFSNLLKVFSSD